MKKVFKIAIIVLMCCVALFWITIETNSEIATKLGYASGPGKPVDTSTNINEIIETSEPLSE